MWTPTESYLHGKITRPFLPLEKHPHFSNDNFKNLYPGDEVYIFETRNDRWARGYTLTKPFPNDFTITSVNLDDLPGLNVKIVVFPLKFFKLVDLLPISQININNEFNNVVQVDSVPTIQESEVAHRHALDGSNMFLQDVRALVPQLPVYKLDNNNDFLLEIKSALELLTSHIFALYSIGEFRLFNKLSQIYYKLHETRVRLHNDLLTTNEIKSTREIATYLLNKIPKKLASKSARLNSSNYDLDNENTDISGYKAILSRDTASGDLLSNDNSAPSKLAYNQVLCALAPNFPINYHLGQSQYSLDPPQNKQLIQGNPSHIMVDFKSVSGSSAFQPPGFAGMIAYLYIRNNKKRLTEAFAVHTNSVVDLVHVEKISAALFKNIPSTEIENSRVYLVAVLTEEIDLNIKKTTTSPLIKRVKKGVAAGVADITRIFSNNKDSLESGESYQFKIRLFGSFMNGKLSKPQAGEYGNVADNGWGELVDRIISGASNGVSVNPRAETLTVSVKEFKHQFTGQTFNPVTSAPISRIKPIFFDPMAENYERIYLTLGKVSLLKSSSAEDLLTIEVSTPNNELITFAKASNQVEKRSWQFISVMPEETIGEIVKVNGVSLKHALYKLPKEDYILLSLYANGILIGEGKLPYKSANGLVEFKKKKTHTIQLFSANVPIAQVEVRSEYIGKAYNYDVSIDHVFQFDSFFRMGTKGVDDLASSLNSFSKLELSQLVKYFPELLSSLSTIVDISIQQKLTPNIEILQDLAFKAIVHLLDTVLGKEDQYAYLMDDFIHKYPHLPAIGVFLIEKMSEILSRAETKWNYMCIALCRVVPLVMKLALNSVDDKENINRVLGVFFKSAASFLTINSESLIDDQVVFMEVVDFILTFKAKFDELQVFKYIVNFIDSIGIKGLGANEDSHSSRSKVVATSKFHKIIIGKLLLIHRLFNTSLVESATTRAILVARSVTWAMDILLGPTDIDATRLACSIFNAVCSLLWLKVFVEGFHEEIDLCYSLSKLLPAISRTFVKYNKYTRGNNYFKPRRSFTKLFPVEHPFQEVPVDPIVNEEVLVEVLCELASIFCFVSKIGMETAGNEGYSKILEREIRDDFFVPEQYLANNFLNEDILTLISGAKLMRQGKFFPEDKWLSLYSVIAEGCLKALELVRPLLIRYYIPDIEQSDLFDRVLWGNYLKTLLRVATLQPVSVEHLSDIPKKACFQITSTVRDRAAFLVNEAWDNLSWDATQEDVIRFNLKKFGGYQVEFINQDYGILQDLMLFALQRNDECQSVGVKILWAIMISEYILSDSIVAIEKECLVGLHEIYYRNAYKPSFLEQERFIERMKITIRIDREDEAFNIVYKFIENLSDFMTVLNDLNSVPVGPEFEDDRTFHKLNIKAYLKNANKPELFHSFINTMYEKNLAKKDYIQAALTLELLASTYAWDYEEIVPVSFRPKFPAQSSFERKELLLKMIAANYIKGNSLERATDTYNELLDAYSAHTYDLKSFSYVHTKLAQLYLDLESSDKLDSSYFRIAFIGAGFPKNIRGKEQIYEGLPFEHITSIHERLLRMYPGARIVVDDDEAEALRVQTGRYLHVTTVEPVSEISDKLFNTSIGVRQYARNKNLRFFSTMKKIGTGSIFELWTEETTYETQLSFPTLMNRSDIKDTTTVKLSPLDNAIRTLINRNNELIQIESGLIKENPDYKVTDLSRVLSGTVDAPVNGGVGQYRNFFTDIKFSTQTSKIRLLKNAFHDLANILNRCLILHGKMISSSMKGSQDVLIELYQKNFLEEIAQLKVEEDKSNQSIRSVPSNVPFGSKMTRSSSRTVSVGSNSISGLSGVSSNKTGQTNQTNQTHTTEGKRTALNWRK